MRKWFYRLRLRLAYFICHEYFDDMEDRMSVLLCHATGGRLSKTNYTSSTMISAVNEYQQSCCDECEFYLQSMEGGEG